MQYTDTRTTTRGERRTQLKRVSVPASGSPITIAYVTGPKRAVEQDVVTSVRTKDERKPLDKEEPEEERSKEQLKDRTEGHPKRRRLKVWDPRRKLYKSCTEPNPFTLSKYISSNSNGRLVAEHVRGTFGPTVTTTGPLMEYWGQSAVSWIKSQIVAVDSALEGAAIAQAYSEASKPILDGFVQFGELREALPMLVRGGAAAVRATQTSWLDFLRQMKKTEWQFGPSAIAQWWLTARYGLMPLYLSLTDIIESMSGHAHEVQVFSGHKERESTVWDVLPTSLDEVSIHLAVRKDFVRLSRAKVVVGYRRDKNPMGFSLIDFIRMKWELLPFSFVVDWFANIGDFLGTLRPVDLGIEWTYCTSICRAKATVSYLKSSSFPDRPHSMSADPFEVKRDLVVRNVGVIPPSYPILHWADLSWIREVDAAALSWLGMVRSLRKLHNK